MKRRCRIVKAARRYIGAEYKLRWEDCLPPRSFNCYTFVWQVMNDAGVLFPFEIREQMELAGPARSSAEISAGSVVFLQKKHPPRRLSINQNGYHVGIRTGRGLIHASQEAGSVIEDPWHTIEEIYRILGIYEPE